MAISFPIGCSMNVVSMNRSDKALIEAANLTLRVPVTKKRDRDLMSNTSRLLVDLYFSKSVRSEVTLLEDVSFTLEPGESLGLIGGNGAGKSTLLRVLAGIYEPSSGALRVNGVAKGLFDISLGMHPEATGLENIYLRGLQMGLGVNAIRSLIPDVMAFSELDEYIDKPLASYSTGMRLRLAIAVSTIIEPDIFLLDEWIGVGDERFNAKVKERMMSLVKGSRGLVLATHNAGLMKTFCTHGLVLDKGRLAFYGTLTDAQKFYSSEILSKQTN